MKTIKKFEHVNAGSLEEAVSILERYGTKAWVMGGGTDLIGTLRFEVLKDYPEMVINLKSIPGLDYIKEEEEMLKIGALTCLEEIAVHPVIRSRYGALAEAARRTASPHIRVMGTIAGNICQLIRCWYFRKEDNRFDCIRKGGTMCHAVAGDNRYHSIFGAMRVGDPPCTANCPAGNEIASYLSSLRENEVGEAAGILIRTNPLAAITGRVCPRNCEKDCNRSELDESISIRAIERFVGDYMLEHAEELYQAPQQENGQKVAVIGSGPAGLTAAYYLRQLGYGVTIYEEQAEAGGVLTYGIPPYRLEKAVVQRQVEAVQRTGVEIKLKVKVGRDISLGELKKQYAAVFCATGAWQQARLNIEHAELLESGLEFLKRMNRGEQKPAAQKVLVIGGGSVAMDVATSARRMGAQEVTLACLESRAEMPALKEEVEQAEREGIVIKVSRGPRRVIIENGQVKGLELKKCTAVYDQEQRFAPQYDENEVETVEADRIILAIGQRPELEYAAGELEIQRGLISVDAEKQATSRAGVYAGGDAVTSGALSVVAAIAGGRRAAQAINQYLGGKETLPSGKKSENLERCSADCHKKLKRVKTPERPLNELSLEREDTAGLEATEVKGESERCLNCGCVAVNPSDVAAALVALKASVVTSKRILPIEELWAVDRIIKSTVLDNDEILTEIRIPTPKPGIKTAFVKFALRKSIDFPIVNCAAAVESEDGIVKSARVCLNAVYNRPYRAVKAEKAIQGQAINEETAEAAGAAVITDAIELPYNKYKIQIAKAMVKKALLACR